VSISSIWNPPSLMSERWNVASYMAAFERPLKERLGPFLPTANRRIRSESVLEENELAARLQDSCDPLNRIHYAWNRAQGKRANHRINTALSQWNAFTRQSQELDVQLRSAPLFYCASNHPRVRFQRKDLTHSCCVVEGEIHTWSDTDFEDRPLGHGDDPLTYVPHGLGITQQSHKMGIDVIFVEGHREFSSPPSFETGL
jgi:hypothetical protein